MKNSSLVWGALLVLLGGLLLLDNMGLLPAHINVWGLFWPLVFIGMGVLGVLSAVGKNTRIEHYSHPLEGVSQARVRLYHGAGELRVDDSAAPDLLLDGAFGGGIDPQVGQSAGETRIDLRMPQAAWSWPPVGGSHSLDWQVALNRQVPLDIEIEGGASRILLNLRELQVKSLRLETGASSTEVDFPRQAGETRARIQAGAASVDLRVPEGVAAQIRVRGGLSSTNIASSRFVRTGDVYESPDFSSAENRLVLDIEMGVGSLVVR